MNLFLLLAGAAALAVMSVHLLVGGRLFAAPLLATPALSRVVKLTLYYCWHLVSLMIAVMAAALFYAALVPGQQTLAAAFTLLAMACALLSLAIALGHGIPLLRMPQWAFFAVVALLGLMGLTVGA